MGKFDLIFAKRLEQIMIERDLYPAQVAKMTGIKRSRIYDYMKGTHQPTAFNLKRIAQGLNVSVDWLIGISNKDKY